MVLVTTSESDGWAEITRFSDPEVLPMPDRHVTLKAPEISPDAANRIGILLDSIDRIMDREQEAMQLEADRKNEPIMCLPALPDALRWRVMVLGCTVEDMNFWVRRDPAEPNVEWYIATEIETGCDVHGVSAREALNNYFKQGSC